MRDIVAIVDDDEAARQSLGFLLGVLGYATRSFKSAQAFWDAEQSQFGCLILDHHMPQVTGLELVERMRRVGIDFPVMILTGTLSWDLRSKASKFGVAKVLEKPPSEEEVLAFVAGAIH